MKSEVIILLLSMLHSPFKPKKDLDGRLMTSPTQHGTHFSTLFLFLETESSAVVVHLYRLYLNKIKRRDYETTLHRCDFFNDAFRPVLQPVKSVILTIHC